MLDRCRCLTWPRSLLISPSLDEGFVRHEVSLRFTRTAETSFSCPMWFDSRWPLGDNGASQTKDAAVSRARLACIAVAIALVAAGCGGGLSLTEYVDDLNALEARASSRAEALEAESTQNADFTPQDLQAVLLRAGEIRIEIQDAANDIEPPEQVAELHYLIFDWHARFMATEEALALRAATSEDTDADWTALSASPEMAEYREAIAEGKRICDDFQAKLDATADRGAFVDVPWVPSDLVEVVEAVLGCEWFPDNPGDIYRWPPVSTG